MEFSKDVHFLSLLIGFGSILYRHLPDSKTNIRVQQRLENCTHENLWENVMQVADEYGITLTGSPTTWGEACHDHTPSFSVCDQGTVLVTLKGWLFATPAGHGKLHTDCPELNPVPMTRYIATKNTENSQ
jgi:hypothetical protein